MLNYKAIAIFASGQARRGKPPVAEAVVHFPPGKQDRGPLAEFVDLLACPW